jgi:hypothetical protein
MEHERRLSWMLAAMVPASRLTARAHRRSFCCVKNDLAGGAGLADAGEWKPAESAAGFFFL